MALTAKEAMEACGAHTNDMDFQPFRKLCAEVGMQRGCRHVADRQSSTLSSTLREDADEEDLLGLARVRCFADWIQAHASMCNLET